MLPSVKCASGSSPPDALLSYFPAVQNYLGLSRSTAHRLAKSGEIATVRLGSRVLVKSSEISRVIAAAEARSAQHVEAAR